MSSEKITLSVDVMSGDLGAPAAVGGVALVAARRPECFFLLHGRKPEIAALTLKHNMPPTCYEIRHADDVIAMDDKVNLSLLQNSRNASMRRALESLASGEAEVVISAGNTAALVALGRRALPRLVGVDRQALVSFWPKLDSHSGKSGSAIFIDAGATLGVESHHLLTFAAMGAAMGRTILGKERPRVALLNVGAEESKGTDRVRRADAVLRNSAAGFDYIGFIEADAIAHGDCDVVVTDGFTGNVAIKAGEGTAQFILKHLSLASRRGSLLDKLSGLAMRRQLKKIIHLINPENYNGGVILGLEGLIFKSRGSSGPLSFARALEFTLRFRNFNLDSIRDDLQALQQNDD